jgi:hypothetical protein
MFHVAVLSGLWYLVIRLDIKPGESFMGFPTKVQLIKRKASEQWYINFPSAIAQAMEFSRGETVEWIVEDKALLALRRLEAPPPALKKTVSSPSSSNSGTNASPPSSSAASPTAHKPSR